MKETLLTVVSNKKIATDTYELKLEGDVGVCSVGQFVEVLIDRFYLRRPFGVADCEGNMLTLLYRVQGNGTEEMSRLKVGEVLNVLTELGKGFNINTLPEKPLLIGGGMGIAPLYYLAKQMALSGARPTVVAGFKSKQEAFYVDEFSKYADVIVTTDDGSLGEKGNVLETIKNKNISFDYYYACGPVVMLKHLVAFSSNGEVSLEARMGCGFGACMGCSIMTAHGAKRVCKEGPVFSAKEVLL